LLNKAQLLTAARTLQAFMTRAPSRQACFPAT
jgi:hypothetical protein